MRTSDSRTNWRQVYGMAALAGGGLGVLLIVSQWNADIRVLDRWSMATGRPVVAALLLMAGSVLMVLVLAGVAHLGIS